MFDSEKLNFVALVFIVILAVLFAGKPDLMDALIHNMTNGKLEITNTEYQVDINVDRPEPLVDDSES